MAFDPYHKWLGIRPKDQPPHHYRLLGIDALENDLDVIDAAANRIMSYLKEIATGDQAAHSQKLLNEVAQARLCLLNRDRKAAYDAELKAKLATRPAKSAKPAKPKAKPAASKRGPLPMVKPTPKVEPIPVGVTVEPTPVTLRMEKPRARSDDEGYPPWLLPAVGACVLVMAIVLLLILVLVLGGDDSGDPNTPSIAEAAGTDEEGPANLSRNEATPSDMIPLFNGVDLTGWQGWVADAPDRRRLSRGERSRMQSSADRRMREHWTVEDGVLVFDGQGDNLCTVQEFQDFELLIDWKIEAGGDSGIYLRGVPQVQIWDATEHPWEGSGGLYNNKVHPSRPLACADNPVGQWNTFRIKMIGERVSVWLNNQLVVDDAVMENHWDRDLPIYGSGPIELQKFGAKIYFRNIYIREISRQGGTTAATSGNSSAVSASAASPPRRVALAELNTLAMDAYPWISPDGSTLYWTREGGQLASGAIWMANRPDVHSRFGSMRKVLEGRHASLTADQLDIVLLPSGQSSPQLHHSRRASVSDPFPDPKPIEELSGQSSPKSPFISADGKTLWFQRRRIGGSETEFVRSTRPSVYSAWSAPQSISLPLDRSQYPEPLTWPSTSASGLLLWFSHGGGKTPGIMIGRRSPLGDSYGIFEEVRVGGQVLVGRCPRYCEATGELFFCAVPSDQSDDWDLYVVKDLRQP